MKHRLAPRLVCLAALGLDAALNPLVAGPVPEYALAGSCDAFREWLQRGCLIVSGP